MNNRRALLVFVGLILAASVGYFTWHRDRPETTGDQNKTLLNQPSTPDLAQKPSVGTPVDEAPQVPAGEQEESGSSESPSRAILRDLGRTYETGFIPVRIRLQDQLNRYWEENPPTAEELVRLVGESSLPRDLRTYLARTFANRVKMRAYSDEEKETAFAELRGMVAAEGEDSLLRADLANVLTTIDNGDGAVNAVAGLLGDSNPQAVQRAVAALTHTTNPLAIEAAYEFVQDDERLLNENPTALLAALAPLSTTDKDVTPMLNRILRQTDDFKLYAGAVQCLIYAKPTVAVLESIAQAYTESKRFPQHAAQAEQMCRAAARRHTKYFHENKGDVEAKYQLIIEDVLKQESSK